MKFKEMQKLKLTLLLTVSGLVVTPPLIAYIASQSNFTTTEADKERFGEYINYFEKNVVNGRPLRLDISDPIAIVMQNIDLETKKQIVKAVTDLDNLCPNLDYVIYEDNYDSAPLKRISFSLSQQMDNSTLGETQYMYSLTKAEIKYPISITLNDYFKDAYFSDNQKPVMESVVKHELLHTLGLTDLYNINELGQSIMYYAINQNVLDYTIRDKKVIDYVYGNRTLATAYHPQTVVFYSDKFCLNKQSENLELEN